IDLFDAAVAREASLDGLAVVYRTAAGREQLHQTQPQAGDLLFLDGSARSPLYPAQVAIVEAVGVDGTVDALGHFLGGARRLRLNLRNPAPLQKSRAGVVNPLLRGVETAHAAQLFRAFADPFG
ncbi:MAG TPA: CHAP domain-containing protein, partial [Myxococcota bacterium]|nr:CHAP domain-containing protein [Myxococcota bacterium]